ncbi:MAG TPA: FKBP-type peptidyl-prolyl cis-trans isomerase [Candidatus Paceibacterota bacterium]
MPKKTLYTGVAVTVTLLVVGFFFILGVPFDSSALNSAGQGAAAVSSQLAVQDVVAGTGPGARAGDIVVVNYTGRLADGTIFDSSVGKTPYSFTLGAGQVIPGWEQGIAGMQVGGKRLLLIPPNLAYGSQDYGPIPGNSTLMFEIDVISITPGPSVPNLQTR